jgi:hypothetical protein
LVFYWACLVFQWEWWSGLILGHKGLIECTSVSVLQHFKLKCIYTHLTVVSKLDNSSKILLILFCHCINAWFVDLLLPHIAFLIFIYIRYIICFFRVANFNHSTMFVSNFWLLLATSKMLRITKVFYELLIHKYVIWVPHTGGYEQFCLLRYNAI